MSESDLLTLLLISSGDYHALRCTRTERGLNVDDLEKSFQRLMADDLVEIVGDEVIVSKYGIQFIDEVLSKI